MAIKLEVENESISIGLEQGNTTVFNITNLCIMSNEQYYHRLLRTAQTHCWDYV